jgi:hypothetical protein
VRLTNWWISRSVGFALFLPTTPVSTTKTAEREMLRLAQLMAREVFVEKRISDAEAFCIESTKQVFEFLGDRGMVCFPPFPTTGVRLYSLEETSTEAELSALCTVCGNPELLSIAKTSCLRCSRTLRCTVLQQVRGKKCRGCHSAVYSAWMSH